SCRSIIFTSSFCADAETAHTRIIPATAIGHFMTTSLDGSVYGYGLIRLVTYNCPFGNCRRMPVRFHFRNSGYLRNVAALYFMDSPLPTPYPKNWRTMPGRSLTCRRLHRQLETDFQATGFWRL